MAGRVSFTNLPNQIPHCWEEDNAVPAAGPEANCDAPSTGQSGTQLSDKVARELREEVTQLRQEISEHNGRLIELVKTRLEAIGSGTRRAPAFAMADSPSVGAARQEAPKRLVVACANGAAYVGAYTLQPGLNLNGFPTWRKDVGDLLFYSTESGMWAISSESCCEDEDPMAIRATRRHGGVMPDKIQAGELEMCSTARADSQPLTFRISSVEAGGGLTLPTSPAPMRATGSGAAAARRSCINGDKQGLSSLMRHRQRAWPSRPRSAEEGLGRTFPAPGQGPWMRDRRISELSRSTSENVRRVSESMGIAPSAISTLTPPAPKKRPQLRKRNSTIFADPDHMKAQLHQQLFKNEVQREDLYKTTGLSQAVVRSKYFEYFALAVITTNAMWIGYDVDKNPSDALPAAPPFFQVVENLFCFYFTGEITLRFMAYRRSFDACTDPQFAFDGFLVALMVVETWLVYAIAAVSPSNGGGGASGAGALSILRMLRLTRMARLARLFRAVPELMVLLKGMSVAFRSMFWTLVLLFMVIYVFAVAFKILTKGHPLEALYFGTLLESMSTLLLPGLLPDSAEVVYAIGEEHVAFAALFMAFVVVGTLGVMNMLIGVMVEGVSAVASVEKEASTMNFVKTELRALLDSLDSDRNAKLSKWEVGDILLNPDACRLINNVGVDVAGLVEIADFHLFNKKDEIGFPEFVELVLQLRGSNVSTVRDVVNLRKFFIEELDGAVDHILDQLSRADVPPATKQGWTAQGPGGGGEPPPGARRRASLRSTSPAKSSGVYEELEV